MYDNTVSARTYLSYIAEQAGGIAVIGRDGKLYIKTIGESSVTLPLKLFKTFKWGEKFKITRVRYDDGIQLFEKGDTTGNTVYISQDNMYIVDQDQINNIYNTLKGLEFYSFEGESIIDPALDTGDIVVIDGKNVIYQGLMQFSGRWIANIESKIQCKAKEETTTRTPSQRTINRRVESNINQIDGKITQLTEETTENTQKITKVEQDVNGITSKVSSVEQSVENITKIEGTAEGKNIYIDDASAEPLIDIMLEGESHQVTRSGKNHFDASQIPSSTNIVVSDNGKIITMPIATSGNGHTSTTKKLSELCPKLKVGDTATLRFNRNLGTTKNMFIYLNVVNSTWGINNPKAITQEMLDSYVALYANRYDDGETGQCILTDFSIMLSSETDTSWEQYGASPSPVYPSEIENLEGKNKFSGWVKGIAINATDGHQLANKTRASSDYIAVDFNQNPNYYLSGLAKTLQTFVAAYNSNKEFLGRTVALLVSYFSLNSSSFIEGTAQGTGDIAYLRATTYENTSSGTTGAIDDVDNLETQLKEGKVATDYVPYNSLEIKDVGKNLFNPSNAKDGYVSDNDGRILGVNIKNKNTGYIKIDGGEKYFILSNKLTGNWGAWYDKDKKFISGIALGGKNKGIVTAPNYACFIDFTISYENNNPDYANNVMIARSDKEIPYKPYQEFSTIRRAKAIQKLLFG